MNTVQSERWPITLDTGGAGRFDVLTSPGLASSHYVVGYSCADNVIISFPRRQYILSNAGSATDFITVSNATGVQVANGKDAVFLFWFKIASSQVSITDFIQKVDSKDGYTFEIDANGKLKATVGDSGTAVSVTSTHAVNNGQWHHCGLYFQADAETDGLILYIDGVENNTTDDVSGISTGGLVGGTNDLYLGKGTSATKTVGLAQFGLYVATDLSGSYATLIGNHCSKHNGMLVGTKFTGSETNLQFALNMDEGNISGGANTTTVDMVGANDGTLEASTMWANGGGPPFQDYHNNSSGATPPHELLPSVHSENLAGQMLAFPHPIKIGRNAPLTVMSNADTQVTFYGYTDSADR